LYNSNIRVYCEVYVCDSVPILHDAGMECQLVEFNDW